MCVASNILGEDRRELELVVETPLRAFMQPLQQVSSELMLNVRSTFQTFYFKMRLEEIVDKLVMLMCLQLFKLKKRNLAKSPISEDNYVKGHRIEFQMS